MSAGGEQKSLKPVFGRTRTEKGMSKKASAPDFEQQMRRLADIVQELERSDLPLERNVALYKEGLALARSCKTLLEEARNEIRLCGEGGETPFAPEDAQTEEGLLLAED